MKRVLTIVAILALGLSMVMAADEPVQKPASSVKMRGEPAVAEFPAVKCVTMMVKAADYAPEGGYPQGPEGISMAYGSMMEKGFGKLGKWMGESKTQPTGPCFAIYYEDPSVTEAAKLTAKIAYPVSGDVTPGEGITIEEIPAMPMAVTLTYEGPYDQAKEPWDAAMKYAPEHGLEWAGAPMEVFHKGPGETQNPQEFVTEIRWPAKKAEAKKE